MGQGEEVRGVIGLVRRASSSGQRGAIHQVELSRMVIDRGHDVEKGHVQFREVEIVGGQGRK